MRLREGVVEVFKGCALLSGAHDFNILFRRNIVDPSSKASAEAP